MTGETNAALRLADLPIPAKGAMVEVAEGVFWLQMPLPMALNHVNLWALDDGDGWCLVDTGMATGEIKGLWEVLLGGPLAGRPVNRIICTHFHPDHAGLSGWLSRRTDSAVWMSEIEWNRARFASTLPPEEFVSGQGTLFRENGLPSETLDRLAAKGNVFRGRVEPIVETVTPIGHGDTLLIGGRAWQVRTGSGHSPDHCCLWCEEAGMLITGDQILPKITPNVSVMWFGDDHDPLQQFISSLRRFAWVPDEALALPGHRQPFTGVRARLDELMHHHQLRLNEALEALGDRPKSANDLLPVLFRRELDDNQIVFALGESLAHLRFLQHQGLAERVSGPGVDRYRATGGQVTLPPATEQAA